MGEAQQQEQAQGGGNIVSDVVDSVFGEGAAQRFGLLQRAKRDRAVRRSIKWAPVPVAV